MTHAPTPWVARNEYIYDSDRDEIGTTTASAFFHGIEDANAAHIVKCVNLHDELVNALKHCGELLENGGFDLEFLESTLRKAGAL